MNLETLYQRLRERFPSKRGYLAVKIRIESQKDLDAIRSAISRIVPFSSVRRVTWGEVTGPCGRVSDDIGWYGFADYSHSQMIQIQSWDVDYRPGSENEVFTVPEFIDWLTEDDAVMQVSDSDISEMLRW